MTTSDHTMKQVRDILEKLDRSIDSARERRLQEDRSPRDRAKQDKSENQPSEADKIIGRARPMRSAWATGT